MIEIPIRFFVMRHPPFMIRTILQLSCYGFNQTSFRVIINNTGWISRLHTRQAGERNACILRQAGKRDNCFFRLAGKRLPVDSPEENGFLLSGIAFRRIPFREQTDKRVSVLSIGYEEKNK